MNENTFGWKGLRSDKKVAVSHRSFLNCCEINQDCYHGLTQFSFFLLHCSITLHLFSTDTISLPLCLAVLHIKADKMFTVSSHYCSLDHRLLKRSWLRSQMRIMFQKKEVGIHAKGRKENPSVAITQNNDQKSLGRAGESFPL